MGIALTEDHLALAEAVRGFSTRDVDSQGTRDQFDALAAGDLPTVWKAVCSQGYLTVHLPEEVGGGGGDVLDLAVVLEEMARALVPGPVLPTCVVSAAVARYGAPALTDRVLPRFVEGMPAGLLSTPDGLTAVRTDDGWLVDGVSAPALGALSGQVLLLCARAADGDVWFLSDSDAAESLSVKPAEGVDLTRDIGRVVLGGHHVTDDQVLLATTSQLRSLMAALFAAEAAGVARWCQESGLQYAKVREQFGRTIGSFQSIKHKCARLFSQVELLSAAAWDAAVAADQDDAQAEFAGAAAVAVCLPSAVDVALETVTLFGGIGYTWEHDTHLYWRRAISLDSLLGPSHGWEERLGEIASHLVRSRVVDLGEEPDGLRAEVSAVLDRVRAEPETERRGLLAAAGLVAPHYPPPYGRSADAVSQVIIKQEFDRVGIPQPSTVIGEWALPTILAHGTDLQRERFVAATLRGEIEWCQLFSEPGAGSDLASLRSTAVRTEGGWLLNGQKVWTSGAASADWAICLARTEPDAPKHRGLGYFLVDMHSPGLEVRPLREANGGYLFNEVFFDDVFIPDEMQVGESGEGWRLARTTLGNERVSIGSGSSGFRDNPAELARGVEADGGAVCRDVGRLTAEANAYEALTARVLLRQLNGLQPGAESSVLKLVSSWVAVDVRRSALSWAGAEGAVLTGADGGAAQAYLSVPPGLIGGGTSEIQLNVIAEHVLGLPRD
ncbi:acyl-CoA dehydrogenase family protein [Nocardioides sp. LHG3406-4]|uniref:acyl-CoA dehydrogenase family protein n=1 Tax=Nocardioides sp. LHG3406-4 TaxID=2804575 RepID=UPI003CF81DB8